MSVWHWNKNSRAISIKENAPDLRQGRFLLYGGEEGIRTLDTFSRIHTFQACSFSLSDTSPGVTHKGQRGATIGSHLVPVKQYLARLVRLAKH